MAATGVTGAPDYYERKGSLFLRSNHMNYGRATLNSNWHQAREAEPKDYNINRADKRDLSKSSYDRVGDVTDGSIPKTTYQDHADQCNLKKYFTEQDVRKPMVSTATLDNVDMERETGAPKRGFGSVLPRHHPDYNKHYLESTHRSDFTPPDKDYVPVPECPPDFPDKSPAYRKCLSQFTDAANHRRPGRNTWQDQSGIYANSHYKQQEFKPTNPIPDHVH